VNPVATAREKREAGARRGFILGFGQDAPPNRNHRIGGQHETIGMARRDRSGLLLRQAQGVAGRQFARVRRFVEIGRINGSGGYPNLPQQIEASRRGGRQD
jgi:hypothetical protein